MPVTVHLLEGRSVAQKRSLARAITDAMVEHADASPGGLHVWFEEYSRDSWARGGALAVDDRADALESTQQLAAMWHLAHVVLEVTDVAAAEAFYVGLLGFSVCRREQTRDGRPLVVTDQGLGLTSGRPAAKGSVEHLAFRARNIAGLAERARAQGGEVISGPEPSSDGISVYLRDPDGNSVELFGPRTAE